MAVPEYAVWLKASIARYEELAKNLVRHRAEKGRIVEAVVKTALRTILPGRFSIGTGFAITASGKTSSQLDLVIYDANFNAPIILEGGTGLFPIECIYGFIEVKSKLDGAEIGGVAMAIEKVRGLASEKRYVAYGVRTDKAGNNVTGVEERKQTLPPRSFLLAVNTTFQKVQLLESNLKKATTTYDGTFLHGVAVLKKDWFLNQIPFSEPREFRCECDRSFERLCASVLDSVQSFPMGPASMSRYLGTVPQGDDSLCS